MKITDHSLSVSMTKQEITGGIIFAPFYLLLFSLLIQFLSRWFSLELTKAQMSLGYYILCAAGVLFVFRRFLAENLLIMWERPGRSVFGLLISLLCYYALILIFDALLEIVLLVSSTDFYNRNDASLISDFSNGPALLLFISLILAPLTEECIFRGLIYSNLMRKSHALAVLVTAGCFSAIHVIPYVAEMTVLQTVISTLIYFPATIVLCEAYRRTDTIFCPMLVHTCINLISLLFNAVNG